MSKSELLKKAPDLVNAICFECLDVAEIWFHGSRATGTAHSRSDWDIYVVVPDSLAGEKMLDLNTTSRGKLSRRFRGIDIQFGLANASLSSVYANACRDGMLLYAKQELPKAQTETTADAVQSADRLRSRRP